MHKIKKCAKSGKNTLKKCAKSGKNTLKKCAISGKNIDYNKKMLIYNYMEVQ